MLGDEVERENFAADRAGDGDVVRFARLPREREADDFRLHRPLARGFEVERYTLLFGKLRSERFERLDGLDDMDFAGMKDEG